MPIDNTPEMGMIGENDIMFLEAIALVDNMDTLNKDSDPRADQMTAFLNESFVFVIEGFKAGEENIRTVIAMPEEAVLFIITKAMERASQAATGITTPITGLTMPPGFPN